MGIYRAVVTITSPSLGGTGTNTWHFRTTGDGAEADAELQGATDSLDLFCQALNAYTAGGTVLACDGVWTQVGVEAGEIHDVTGFTAGSAGGNPLPPQDCVVIGWTTGVAGRTGRGRTFVGPMETTALEANGTPTEEVRTDYVAAGQALIDAFDGPGDGSYVVWSEKLQIGRDFTGAVVRNKFGSLRSRRD